MVDATASWYWLDQLLSCYYFYFFHLQSGILQSISWTGIAGYSEYLGGNRKRCLSVGLNYFKFECWDPNIFTGNRMKTMRHEPQCLQFSLVHLGISQIEQSVSFNSICICHSNKIKKKGFHFKILRKFKCMNILNLKAISHFLAHW